MNYKIFHVFFVSFFLFPLLVFAVNDEWVYVGEDRFGEQGSACDAHVAINQNNGDLYVASNYYYNSIDESQFYMFNNGLWEKISSNINNQLQDFFISKSGVPYASFSEPGNKIAYYENSVWNFIESSGDKGYHIVTDSIGNVYALTIAGTTSKYFVVNKYDGDSWSVVGANITTSIAIDDSVHDYGLFIDGSDALYVAYSFTDEGYVIKFDGNNWIDVGGGFIDPSENMSVEEIDMAFSSNNTPYISFENSSDQIHVRKYVDYWADVSGSHVAIGNGAHITYNEKNSQMYISFSSGFGSNVFRENGGSWEMIGNGSFGGNPWCGVSVAVYNKSGMPYIAIADDDQERLSVMKYVSGTPIYRLYNTKTGIHLYTRGKADRDYVLSKWPEFEFTDGVPAFYASLSDDGNTPIYRLYNTKTGVHLYTRGTVDRDYVLSKWPEFEFTDGIPAFYASLSDDGNTPIYRLYNIRTGIHLYTRGESDRNYVLNKWSDFLFTDGVPAFYAQL